MEGIYTHIATSGINDIYYDKQINKFIELTKDINLKEIVVSENNQTYDRISKVVCKNGEEYEAQKTGEVVAKVRAVKAYSEKSKSA